MECSLVVLVHEVAADLLELCKCAVVEWMAPCCQCSSCAVGQ
jgi:hypothetical protein